MKTPFTIAVLFALISSVTYAGVTVKGYSKKSGKFVQPHFRSKPDKYLYNNYSKTKKSFKFPSRKKTK